VQLISDIQGLSLRPIDDAKHCFRFRVKAMDSLGTMLTGARSRDAREVPTGGRLERLALYRHARPARGGP
jgi:hypothetical protein